MISVIASMQIREGRLPEFIEIFKANIPNVLRESGCIEYRPTIDIASGLAAQELNRNVVTIIEKWGRLDDLQAHLSAPHMLAYSARVRELVVGRSLKILTDA